MARQLLVWSHRWRSGNLWSLSFARPLLGAIPDSRESTQDKLSSRARVGLRSGSGHCTEGLTDGCTPRATVPQPGILRPGVTAAGHRRRIDQIGALAMSDIYLPWRRQLLASRSTYVAYSYSVLIKLADSFMNKLFYLLIRSLDLNMSVFQVLSSLQFSIFHEILQ